MTLRAGVAGWPIAHSLSPVIHGAWLAAAGLDAAYDRFGPEDEAAFRDLVERMRAGELVGLNVTAPWKEQAMALADHVSETARACGSANLIWHHAGALWADSTDGRGLMAALGEQAPGLDPAGKVAVVLGAGGASRAAVHALGQAFAEVRIINRTAERAIQLVSDLQPHTPAVLTHRDSGAALNGAALVVNALSVAPQIDFAALDPEAVLMDITYRPLRTEFLAEGAARGHTTVDGLAMLIGQARPSFEALFGRPVPDVDVRAAALAALEATG